MRPSLHRLAPRVACINQVQLEKDQPLGRSVQVASHVISFPAVLVSHLRHAASSRRMILYPARSSLSPICTTYAQKQLSSNDASRSTACLLFLLVFCFGICCEVRKFKLKYTRAVMKDGKTLGWVKSKLCKNLLHIVKVIFGR
jgi:hypothetical protein